MTEKLNNKVECGPLITEEMVVEYPILEDWYYKERNRLKEAGRPVWIQRSFEPTDERVVDYFVEEAEPRAFILQDRKNNSCKSFVTLYKEGLEDQEVTVKGEEFETAQRRLEYIVSKIPVRAYESERGDPELPGLL